MNEQDVVTLNMFAAAVMPPVGPHDTDAVLAERIKRAFAVAELMLAHSLTYRAEQVVFTVQQPESIDTILQDAGPIIEAEVAQGFQDRYPRCYRCYPDDGCIERYPDG